MYRALSLSVAVALGVLAAIPANAADKVTWNFALYGPPRAVTVTFEHLAKVAKEKSGGNFVINLKYNEQLSEAKDMLDGLKVDAFQGVKPKSSQRVKAASATAEELDDSRLARPSGGTKAPEAAEKLPSLFLDGLESQIRLLPNFVTAQRGLSDPNDFGRATICLSLRYPSERQRHRTASTRLQLSDEVQTATENPVCGIRI